MTVIYRVFFPQDGSYQGEYRNKTRAIEVAQDAYSLDQMPHVEVHEFDEDDANLANPRVTFKLPR